MKKVIIVQNISFYAWHMRFDLAKKLKENGYQVIFVSSSDNTILSKVGTGSSKDIYIEKIEKEFDYFDINISRGGTNPIDDLKTTYNFYKIYKRIKPDIVLHYTIKPNIYGSIAANFLGIPVINNIAGLGSLFIEKSFVTKIAKYLYKFSQKNANKIFFQNPDDLYLFVQDKLVSENKCDLLPGSGVNTDKFSPIALKNRDSKLIFLMIARLLKDKGVYEYIDAIKILKNKYNNVEFRILGAIDLENKTAIPENILKKWIEEGLINYLGVSDDVRKEISQADCVVLPSYREGTPRSLLEASSMGKVIVTTNVAGCKEVVEDGVTGFLCEVKNPKDLAEKLEIILNMTQEEREIMGKNGREKIVREFDEQIVFNKYLDSIKEILE